MAALRCFVLRFIAIATFAIAMPVSVSAQDVGKPLSLRAENAKLKTQISKLDSDFAEIQKKLNESSWRALDTTTALGSFQWTIIAVVFGVLGLIGLGGATLIRNQIYSSVRESMREDEEITRRGVQAITFSKMSFAFWQQYDQLKASTEPWAKSQRDVNLASAISLGKLALDESEKLRAASIAHGKQTPEDLEKHLTILTSAQANLAFWLAEITDAVSNTDPHPSNRQTAFRLGREAYAVGLSYMNKSGMDRIEWWPDWIECHCHTLDCLGGPDQKEIARSVIKKVCDDLRVPEVWRRQIRAEYGLDKPPYTYEGA